MEASEGEHTELKRFLLHKGVDAMRIAGLLDKYEPREALLQAKFDYKFTIDSEDKSKFDLPISD